MGLGGWVGVENKTNLLAPFVISNQIGDTVLEVHAMVSHQMSDWVSKEASVRVQPHPHRDLPRSVLFVTVGRVAGYFHGCSSSSSREFQPRPTSFSTGIG